MAQRVAFVWRRPSPPFFIGGAEISQHTLASMLAREGYEIFYIGSYCEPHNHFSSRQAEFERQAARFRINFEPTSSDQLHYFYDGLECLMVRQERIHAAVQSLLQRRDIDIIITAQEGSSLFAAMAMQAGLHTIGWLHSATPTGLSVLSAKPTVSLATSRFVQGEANKRFSAPTVLFYPPFDLTPVYASAGDAITLVNPIPEKGVNIFLQLAAHFPQRRFLAVEGWSAVELQNPPQNVIQVPKQWNIQSVWKHTAVVLVPSRIPEGFGRVIVEAGSAGVPAIAAGVGGIPEAIGSGGIIMGDEHIARWVKALAALLHNPELYEELSNHARHNAWRFRRNPVEELYALAVLPA